MLTVNEAAAQLKLSAKWVRHLCNIGRFPGAVKLGGNGPGAKQWRIPQADLDAIKINRGWQQFRSGDTHEINQRLGRQ